MYGEIVAVANSSSQHTIHPGDFLVFGRGKNADIILDDNAISRLHCKVFYHQAQFWIQDFGSRNSTLVNNQRVSRQPLKQGDVIRLGRHRFRFQIYEQDKKDYHEDEQESFSKLKRHDKLIGKIAVELGYIKRSQVKKCILLQETLSEDGDYVHLEDIFLQEDYLDSEQIQKINKYKIQVPSIEGYKLQELIGIGGMGKIYKGRFNDDSEPVAVKVLSSTEDENHMQLSHQFIREAKAIAKLNHKNIVAGLDFGFAGKNIYIVMEYIDGPNLQQHLKEQGGRLLPDETLNMVMQIASALEHAHSCGLVHRDIKTDNILLATPNSVKLCDFGLVRDVDEVANDEEKVFGTVAYMSPEQCLFKKNIDIRSDIYSLGVVFFRMLYGDLPFKGAKKEVRRHHVQTPIPFPKSQSSEKQDLEKIIAKMMAKSPKERYSNPTQLLRDLNAAAKNFSPLEDSDGTAEVDIEYSLVSLDDTETRMLKNPLETQELSPWDLINFMDKMSQAKNLSMRYWKYLAALGIFALVCFVFLFTRSTSQKIEYNYTQAQQQIQQLHFEKATTHISALKTIQPDYINKLQQYSLSQIARFAEKNPRRALTMYRMALEWQEDSATANDLRKLYQQLQQKIALDEQNRSFWMKWKTIEEHIQQREMQNLNEELSELYSLATTREHREAYQKLQEKFARRQIKQELQDYNFTSQYELNLELYRAKNSAFATENFYPLAFEKPQSKATVRTGSFFVYDKPFLYCISAKDGRGLWVKKLRCEVESFADIVFLHNGTQTTDFSKVNRILLCDYDAKTFYLLDAQNGEEIWNFQLSYPLSAKIACFENKIYLPCLNRNTYVVDIQTRKALGGYTTSSKCVVRPFAYKEALFLPCYDGKIFGFHRQQKTLRHYVISATKPMFFAAHVAGFIVNVVKENGHCNIYQYQVEGLQSSLAKKYSISHTPLKASVHQRHLYISTQQYLYQLDVQQKETTPLANKKFILTNDQDTSQIAKLIPSGEIFAHPQMASQSLFMQVKLSQGVWCGHFYQGKKMWEKRIGVPWHDYNLYRDNIWLTAKDGRLYCAKLGAKDVKYRYIPGNNVKEVRTSLARVVSKNDKLLTMNDYGKVSLYDFRKGKRYKIAKVNVNKKKKMPQAYVYRGVYAFICDSNKLRVVSLKNGKDRYRTYIAPRDFATAPLFFRGYIFVALKDKHLYCLKLIDKKGRPYIKNRWRFKSKRQINKLVQVKTTLYLTDTAGYVYAVNMKNGRRKWYQVTGGRIDGPPLYHNKHLYTCNHKGVVFKISLSGRIVWKKRLGETFELSPQTNGEYLYVVSQQGKMFKLDLQDGVVFRETNFKDVPQIFFRHASNLYVGGGKGLLYSLSE
ncbi:protein kinase domain-containing protein [Candidatus Uabimicrobium amorphum]|uniref:Protein kinase n=1 Tax=Uabimicrobium amorphum TaxID=2596890 RepID=A0A5S9F5D2_UABAM|nr:FHA domain-containing serine/threonine-protein kinase [Candidatus Uabimicrobium amorphum]BBM86737.1 protein kinase [Candidatus Uabimicrobium amorphum]